MKKATVVLLVVIQIALLFIFHNIQTLFNEYESIGIRNPAQFLENMQKLKQMFSALSIIIGLTLLATGFYLVLLFKKAKEKPDYQSIPPLHDYLLQLKSSESQLKSMVETQQEKVVQKEELNKNIINNINAAIIFLNPGGRIEIFNSFAETIFSQSYANAKNNVLEKVLSGFPEIVDFVRRNDDQKASGEIISNEKTFWVHQTPIEQVGLLFIIRDVSEEKKREEIDRRNSNFVMLGEMTAFLAHEVRNSLGVIYGYSRTIKSKEDGEKVVKINKEILFLTEMMESFLNFSKPVTSAKKEEMDLAALLKRIAAEKDLALEMTGEPVMMENDPALLQSVFSNLVLNSKEAGADRIDVTVKRDVHLEIYLKDNGKGIPAANLEKIWFPFFTTKEKGTGMGLASIRKIINSLNGDIQIENSTQGETTFKIVFFG
jgi:two-component system sensor histidine kinase PilS (NtrC family)